MSKGMKIFMAILMVIYVQVSTRAMSAEKTIDVKTIVERIDSLYRSKSSFGEFEMQIITPNWQRTLKLQMWTEGMKKTFIRILSPKKDRGIATLRIENQMWNYFPRINKVMKVPPSMMMGSWMGSDFTNDDLVKESTLIEDYDYKLITPKDANPEYYYIELIPKKTTASVWGKIILVVEKNGLLPVRQEFYDEKGNKMRIMTFSEVKEMGGRKLPTVLEMIPLNKKNHKTVIKYLSVEFDKPISKDIFSLRNLRKKI